MSSRYPAVRACFEVTLNDGGHESGGASYLCVATCRSQFLIQPVTFLKCGVRDLKSQGCFRIFVPDSELRIVQDPEFC